MENNKLKLIASSFGMDRVKLNQPLAEYSALKVGGPADLFFIAFTQNELIKIITFCKDLKTPFFLFGTGSKMMVSEKGFEGVVVKNRTRNIKVVSIKGKVGKGGIGVESALVEVDSGVTMASLVEFLDKQGLSCLEFINTPGSIGGNLFINKHLQQKCESLKVLNQNLVVEKIDVLNISLQKHIILSAVFKVKAKG